MLLLLVEVEKEAVDEVLLSNLVILYTIFAVLWIQLLIISLPFLLGTNIMQKPSVLLANCNINGSLRTCIEDNNEYYLSSS
jgi:hypothetical protein